MSAIIIRQGLVVGEHASVIADVLIVDGRIAEVAATIDAPSDAHEVDARDCWVGPGFVDLHTHLREPGREAAESIESGARAGALGGYCALVAMPNTEPALDNVALVSYVLERGARTPLDIAVAGAITQERRGELLAPMAEMAALGIRLFTDDGVGVQDPSVMRRALTYAKPLGVRLAQHCEDEQLAAGGTMNEGPSAGARPHWTPGVSRRADGDARHRTRTHDYCTPAFFSISRRVAPCSWYSVRARRDCRSPSKWRRTTSRSTKVPARVTTRCSRFIRRCARPVTSRRCAMPYAEVWSMPWRPTTPRTRPN